MKVAVCFSGLVRYNALQNIADYRTIFPYADFFFHTWEGQSTQEIDEEFYTTEEPVIDYIAYDSNPQYPFIRTIDKHHLNGEWRNLAYNRPKQIIAHADLLCHLPEEYDMIVRARYDVKPSLKNNDFWHKIITEAYDLDQSVGVGYEYNVRTNMLVHGTPYTQWETPSLIVGVPLFYEEEYHHADHMMIHRRDRFDTDKVYRLHKNHELFPAEVGWWQILCEEKSRCIYVTNGVILDKWLKNVNKGIS